MAYTELLHTKFSARKSDDHIIKLATSAVLLVVSVFISIQYNEQTIIIDWLTMGCMYRYDLSIMQITFVSQKDMKTHKFSLRAVLFKLLSFCTDHLKCPFSW